MFRAEVPQQFPRGGTLGSPFREAAGGQQARLEGQTEPQPTSTARPWPAGGTRSGRLKHGGGEPGWGGQPKTARGPLATSTGRGGQGGGQLWGVVKRRLHLPPPPGVQAGQGWSGAHAAQPCHCQVRRGGSPFATRQPRTDVGAAAARRPCATDSEARTGQWQSPASGEAGGGQGVELEAAGPQSPVPGQTRLQQPPPPELGPATELTSPCGASRGIRLAPDAALGGTPLPHPASPLEWRTGRSRRSAAALRRTGPPGPSTDTQGREGSSGSQLRESWGLAEGPRLGRSKWGLRGQTGLGSAPVWQQGSRPRACPGGEPASLGSCQWLRRSLPRWATVRQEAGSRARWALGLIRQALSMGAGCPEGLEACAPPSLRGERPGPCSAHVPVGLQPYFPLFLS